MGACVFGIGTVLMCERVTMTGILAAVFWFPLGVGLCLLDRKVYCERCGVMLDDGIGC